MITKVSTYDDSAVTSCTVALEVGITVVVARDMLVSKSCDDPKVCDDRFSTGCWLVPFEVDAVLVALVSEACAGIVTTLLGATADLIQSSEIKGAKHLLLVKPN